MARGDNIVIQVYVNETAEYKTLCAMHVLQTTLKRFKEKSKWSGEWQTLVENDDTLLIFKGNVIFVNEEAGRIIDRLFKMKRVVEYKIIFENEETLIEKFSIQALQFVDELTGRFFLAQGYGKVDGI